MAPTPPLPDVTVIVPTRNRVELLPATLASVFAQTAPPARVVVVDEGSVDGTRSWLETVGDPRLVVVDGPCRGVSAARNRGLREVDTQWVAFCDDDDLWSPAKLASQMTAAVAAGARWVLAGSVGVEGADLRVVNHQALPHGDLRATLLERNVVPGGGSGVLVAAEEVLDVGGFDESLAASEDWDLWIRLVRRSVPAVADAPLVGYRLTPGSMSVDVEAMLESRAAVLARHGGQPAVGARDYERYVAKQQLRSGDRRAAGRYLHLALAGRDVRDLTRAAFAAAAPRAMDRRGWAQARREVPAAWLAEADAWLEPYRATATPSNNAASVAADRR